MNFSKSMRRNSYKWIAVSYERATDVCIDEKEVYGVINLAKNKIDSTNCTW